MTSARRTLATVVCGASLLVAGSGFAAGPTAQDFETARVLYKEGKDLHAKGDLKGAYQKLLAAHSLGHTPITGVELAKVEVELGMLVEAREVCLGIARMPVEPDETKRSAEARDEAAKLAESLKPRIPSITIRIVPAQTNADLLVDVDGSRVPVAALSEPRRVNPGTHALRAQYEGGDAVTLTVKVGEAETKDVALSPPAPKIVVKPPPPPPPIGQRPPRTGLSGLTIAGFITAGVGLAVGGGAGIAAIAYKSSLDCGSNKVCTGSQIDTLDSANTAATVSNFGFVVAGVGAVLTIIGFLTTPSRTNMGQSTTPKNTASVTPDLGLGWVGVHGRF